jgi:hypothetical protein
MEMPLLNLPQHPLKFQSKGGKLLVQDVVQKKLRVLTPEEWVRQNFLNYLIHDNGYPASLLAVEKGLRINNLAKRCDIIAYNKEGKPVVLIECKASNVALNQQVFDQIARYNLKLEVPYLVVTNGIHHIYCSMDLENKKYVFIKDLPKFNLF